MYDAGYAGLTWPEGVRRPRRAVQPPGDRARGVRARRGAASHMDVIGLGMAGPTIMAHGTEEQKQRYLPKMLSAEEIWCQGFSEPGAGSDLSAVRTRDRGRGRRASSSTARRSGRRSRTSPTSASSSAAAIRSSERHAGLTYVIVDMHAPGVEVRPLRQITGEAEFNEIFFTRRAGAAARTCSARSAAAGRSR